MFLSLFIFGENGKGLTLLFGPNLDVFIMTHFCENDKGLTLLFGPKLDFFIMTHLW